MIPRLAAMTGLLAVLGLLSVPFPAAASETPIRQGDSVLGDHAVTATDAGIPDDNLDLSPGTAITAIPPGIKNDRKHAADTTKNPCSHCDTTTTDTTTTTHPCGCDTTTTNPTTTTPEDTDTTTSTTTTTTSTSTGTGTTEPAGGTHVGNNDAAPPAPEALAHTGTNTALVQLLAVGVLLLVLGSLLFVIARARTRGRWTPPNA